MFGIIHRIIQNDSLKNEVYKFQYTAYSKQNTWGSLKKRRWGKDSPFLWFATKCKCQATYDLNVEAISFASGRC